MGNNHISFTTSKIGSYMDVQNSKDPNGMRVFYYLIQDLKCLVFSIISLHFRIKPVQGWNKYAYLIIHYNIINSILGIEI